jgi:hypothetical protein
MGIYYTDDEVEEYGIKFRMKNLSVYGTYGEDFYLNFRGGLVSFPSRYNSKVIKDIEKRFSDKHISKIQTEWNIYDELIQAFWLSHLLKVRPEGTECLPDELKKYLPHLAIAITNKRIIYDTSIPFNKLRSISVIIKPLRKKNEFGPDKEVILKYIKTSGKQGSLPLSIEELSEKDCSQIEKIVNTFIPR